MDDAEYGREVCVSGDPRRRKLPPVITLTKRSTILIAAGRAPHVDCELSSSHDDEHPGKHFKCAPGLIPGELCVKGAKLTFHAPGVDQVFIVTDFDAETGTWTAKWPD